MNHLMCNAPFLLVSRACVANFRQRRLDYKEDERTTRSKEETFDSIA